MSTHTLFLSRPTLLSPLSHVHFDTFYMSDIKSMRAYRSHFVCRIDATRHLAKINLYEMCYITLIYTHRKGTQSAKKKEKKK